CQQYNTLPYSF
nr:immunoglobulin light chain junction region [Macaca mulatta]MOV93077.1 immunoglobulin light chain junction region [Macaca mulatta]MOX51650.1 immunoglobulin light chain junction region [Macaca mulatta]MOX52117.1 immunoglobulin light chain junction region [Macaca mulatta]MOX52991.1 immunoglobulin light chain junction region [Macaca mulatta]